MVGRKFDDSVEEPTREEIERGVGRFLDKTALGWDGSSPAEEQLAGRSISTACLNAIVKGDEVVGASVLARDVTEEREKERRFTELFETLQEGVYFCTPEGKLLDANPALVSMLGYVNKTDLLAVDPKALNVDPAQTPVLGRSADDRGGVRTREITLRRRDGSVAICQDTSRAVWDEAGTIIRYQGTLIDVTEQRKMESALRQQEQFRQQLLESFPDLILVVDLEERYTFVSSRIRDLLGYRPEELVGKKIEDLQDHSPEFLSLYRDVASGKQAVCASGVRGAASRRKLADHARFGQPVLRFGEQAQRRHYFGARHHGREEAGAADHPERTAGGDGADDRRIRARTQQSADHHRRGERTAAGGGEQ